MFILPKELEELKALKQWACYKLEKQPTKNDPDHMGKPPYDPKTGRMAKVNNPNTWNDYETCAAALESGKYDGLGIMLADGLCGVDLDHVLKPIEKDGRKYLQLKKEAAEIVNTMDSYTEISPSGDGLHILGYGKMPKGRNRVYNADGTVYEMYDTVRFLTITGKAYSRVKPAEITEQAAQIHKKYWPQEQAAPDPDQRQPQKALSVGLTPDFSQWLDYSRNLTDAELLESIFKSGVGPKVKALFDGDMSDYGNDHSRADAALCCYLYNFTADKARTEALFEMSALCRDAGGRSGPDNKWNRPDYRARTLEGAVNDPMPLIGYIEYTKEQKREYAQAMASQRASQSAAHGDGDQTGRELGWSDEITGGGSGSGSEAGSVPASPETVEQDTQKAEKAPKDPQPDEVTKYIDSGLFNADLERFRLYKDRKTGFSNIDKITSLYPGLYALGAISSLGKTTFALQLADQLATAGDHVLYFSLEQTRAEMISKSISRYMLQLDQEHAASAINIRRGHYGLYEPENPISEAPAHYDNAIEAYCRDVGGRLSIVELTFRSTVEEIRSATEDYIKANGVTPVVFIDYMQILSCMDKSLNDKQRIDFIVESLKDMQKKNDLALIVISSLNRQNYSTPVDFESFKESGGIEYTADVVWGLELQIMYSDLFNKEGHVKEKRDAIKKAKRGNTEEWGHPREVMLTCLKNRYGIANYTCGFNYYPQADCFVPDDDFTPAGKEIPFDGKLH